VDLDSVGRLVLSTSEYSEHPPPKAAGGQEGFILRLEAVRTASLIAAAEGVVAAMGWRRAVPPEPPPAPVHRHECFKCHFGSLPIAIEFDLCDIEVKNLGLVLEDGTSIHAPGMDDFIFADGGDQAFQKLQRNLRERFSFAERLLKSAELSCEVLNTLGQHAKRVEDGCIHIRLVAVHLLELQLEFHDLADEASAEFDLSSPFQSPVVFKIHEQLRTWSLCGKLRTLVPITESREAPEPLPCGGRLQTEVFPNGQQEVQIHFDQASLKSPAWRHWSTDLRALAFLAAFRRQAEVHVGAELPGHRPQESHSLHLNI